MANSIFDQLTSANAASYWNTLQAKEAPYLGEILFPGSKQRERMIEFYKGETRAPKPLRPAAYGTQSIQRDRQGLTKVSSHTNFYKESKYTDENLMADLGDLAQSNNQQLYSIALNNIFNDQAELLRGAKLTRELVRMQLLLTGKYKFSGNGATSLEDYKMKTSHFGAAKDASWQATGSDPAYDIQTAIDKIATDQGVTINQVIMNTKTFRALMANNQVKSTLLANNANTSAVALPRQELINYLLSEYSLTVVIYDKNYIDDNGALQYFIPDGKIVFTPGGQLGRTVFSSTPEERSQGMIGSGANVSFVDDGVAITTKAVVDPVSIQTIVSQEFGLSFEGMDDIFVFDAFNPKA